MFSKTPELYDLIYGSMKDYGAESRTVAQILKERVPDAERILDVGCGTGEHARWLHDEHGYRVDGLDVEPGFVALARKKLPHARFWEGDMAAFDVEGRYDAILCLFSAIGYVREPDRVTATLQCFRRHLEPEGAVLVEPWFTPAEWHPGRVYLHRREADGLTVARMSHSTVTGRMSHIELHYLVGGAEGVIHEVEHHELGLFTRSEMSACFEEAGFGDVVYDEVGLTGRGLYVATV